MKHAKRRKGDLRPGLLALVLLATGGFKSCAAPPFHCLVAPASPGCTPSEYEILYSWQPSGTLGGADFEGYCPFLGVYVEGVTPGFVRFDARRLDPAIKAVYGALSWSDPSGNLTTVIATDAGAFVYRTPDSTIPSSLALRLPRSRLGDQDSNVTAIETIDPATVLLGQRDKVGRCSAGVRVCDLRSGTCTDATGLPPCTGYDFPYVLKRISGSGESALVLAGYARSGAHRSSDGGRTWSPSPLAFGMATAVTDLLSTGTAVLAATSRGTLRSTDLGSSWQTSLGGVGLPCALARQGPRVFVANSYLAVVHTSTDAGVTWSRTGFDGRATVTRHLSATSRSLILSTNAGLFRSTDSGASWQTFSENPDIWTVSSLADTGSALLSGIMFGQNGVRRSTDGGRTFVNGPAVLDNALVTSVAAQGSNVLVATTGSIHRSTDDGRSFVRATPTGLSSMTGLSFASVGGALYASGLGQRISRSLDGGASFSPADTGIAERTSYVFGLHDGSTYAGGEGGRLFRSQDGRTWLETSKVYSPDEPYKVTALVSHQGALFVSLDGFSNGAHGVYKTTDGGTSFSRVSSGIAPSSRITSLASAGGVLYAGSLIHGLYASSDAGSTWTQPVRALVSIPVTALLVSGGALQVGTRNASSIRVSLPLSEERIVPVVLEVASDRGRFTTELALTNRGTTLVTAILTYTASLGSGSGSVVQILAQGQQLILPEVIDYLRTRGLEIPSEGAQAGTLRVLFSGISATGVVAATARTTSSTPAGGASGVAYSAVRPELVTTTLRVFGLRSSRSDRSNLAVYNVGEEPVTLRVTAFSGAGGDSRVIAEAETLPAFGWKQYDEILAGAGYETGWVEVVRVSERGLFSAYGVVNDKVTNDGSFILPSLALPRIPYATVPVLVETTGSPPFQSELVLANASSRPATLRLRYVESLSPDGGAGGTATFILPAGAQRIEPDALQFLRDLGIGIGARGSASYAGSLRVDVSDAPIQEVYIGARTASRSPADGQYGLFMGPTLFGDEATDEAYLYGLEANERNRSNVAVLNTGSSGSITVQLQAHDGDDAGRPKGSAAFMNLQPGQWNQLVGFLGASGIRNGWVKVTRTSGSEPWVAYAVVNDGGAPGEGTGDGALVPMELP